MAILSREDLRNRLKHREIAPVYLLFGAETYLRDLAAKTIAEFVLRDSSLREFNEIEHSLNDSKLQYVIGDAEQLPMMSDRRVVIARNVRVAAVANRDSIKEEEEAMLSAYLTRPAQTSVVIFVADEIDKRRKMAKVLLENTVAVEFTLLQGFALKKYSLDKFNEYETRIDERALERLLDLVGSNLRRLVNEIEKLTVAALPDKIVSDELINSLVPNSAELTNFSLTDSLVARDKGKTFVILKKILDDGAEPLMLLGLLANNYHRLLLAKTLMDEGYERRDVARVMKLPPNRQEDFLANARRTDLTVLNRIMEKIAAADLAIKTSQGTPRLQLEILVSELVSL